MNKLFLLCACCLFRVHLDDGIETVGHAVVVGVVDDVGFGNGGIDGRVDGALPAGRVGLPGGVGVEYIGRQRLIDNGVDRLYAGVGTNQPSDGIAGVSGYVAVVGQLQGAVVVDAGDGNWTICHVVLVYVGE